MPLSPITLVASAIIIVLLFTWSLRRKTQGLKNLRGPPHPSILFGNELQLGRQKNVGSLDFQWMREYGPTWLTMGYFGTKQVMTADPKALQHILHKSGYNYPKRVDLNHMTYLTLGPGIIWAQGMTHQRQRKVMNPAFSAQQLRTFVPLIQRTGVKLTEIWKSEVAKNPGGVIIVNRWLARATLDVIGKAAFDYQFGALDDTPRSALADLYSNIFRDTLLYPSRSTLLFRALWQYFPEGVLELIKYSPGDIFRRLRDLNRQFADIGRPLIETSSKDGFAHEDGKRDVMSVLVKANASENEKARLGDEEVLAQMHHLTVAGHETTSNTLGWMFYELAQYPEYQTRIREEIRSVRAAVVARGDSNFTIEDLDSMKFTLAAIKETLRFHPIVYNIWRYAAKDDVIPLSEPVVGKDGEVISEIPISAGQGVIVSICGYNRLPQVWGENPDRWDPERFLHIDQEKQVKLGVYANLLTFSAGLRGCIGWRFAVYELQALAAEILENFEFALPKAKPTILRAPGGVMMPLIEGQEDSGSAMPLRVSLVA